MGSGTQCLRVTPVEKASGKVEGPDEHPLPTSFLPKNRASVSPAQAGVQQLPLARRVGCRAPTGGNWARQCRKERNRQVKRGSELSREPGTARAELQEGPVSPLSCQEQLRAIENRKGPSKVTVSIVPK